MENTIKKGLRVEGDNQASSRKGDHIDLAFKASISQDQVDDRFYYEPLMSAHPSADDKLPIAIAGRAMDFPIWVSSMTGGTEKAAIINENLARICGEFGLGMGLGSCRQLLYEDKRLPEFALREYMNEQPLFINLGVAQIEELISSGELDRIESLIHKLDADGLIIHVNPLQEWCQPEGDKYKDPALTTIKHLLSEVNYPVIVKEVGQGFGKQSLTELLQLPIEALDLAGFGGTNFSMLELIRSDKTTYDSYKNVCQIGHTCEEMIHIINDIKKDNSINIRSKMVIISGGIKDFLDGYHLTQLCQMQSLYAQASGFLRYAMNIDKLRQYTIHQIEGLKMANAFLRIKS